MSSIVSICIPVYNGAKWLRACLDSACDCTVASEIIVCDDGSSDDSLNIAKEYAQRDPRVQVHRNERNLGLVGNWNQSLTYATGEWIKFLFQDDRLQPGSVERMVEAAQPADMLIAARRNFVFSENSSAESKKYYTEKVLTLDKVADGTTRFSAEQMSMLFAKYIALNFIGEPSTLLFRASLLSSLGNFNDSFRQICDLEFWARVATRYGLVYVPDAVIDFTVHDESVSASNAANAASSFDALKLVHAFCYGKEYEQFQKVTDAAVRKRLDLWLRIHSYDARRSAKTDAEQKQVAELFVAYPGLDKASRRFGNGLLSMLLRLRRG